jgi:hypothetical protein
LVEVQAIRATAAVGPTGIAIGDEQVDVAVAVTVASSRATDRVQRNLKIEVCPSEQCRSRVADLVRDARVGRNLDKWSARDQCPLRSRRLSTQRRTIVTASAKQRTAQYRQLSGG